MNFDGQTYSFEVKPGPDGYQKFTDAIRRAFTLPDDSELNITFTCDEPGVGKRLACSAVDVLAQPSQSPVWLKLLDSRAGPAPEQHPPPIITSGYPSLPACHAHLTTACSHTVSAHDDPNSTLSLPHTSHPSH